MLKKYIIAVLISLVAMPVAFASDLKAGDTAYKKGDFKTALHHWQPLAEQGNKDAQFAIGTLYNDGQGIAKDYKKSLYWYTKSAQQGHQNAQAMLSMMHFQGKGVSEDHTLAYMWGHIASHNGSKQGQKMVDLLGIALSPQDIKKAQEMSNRCFKSGYTQCGYE